MLKIESQVFMRGITVVARAAEKRNLVGTVQSGILLTAKVGMPLTMQCSSMATAIKTERDCDVYSDMEVLLNCKDLAQLTKKLPEGTVTIKCKDKTVLFELGKFKASLPILESDKFISMPVQDKCKCKTLTLTPENIEQVSKVAFVALEATDSAKPVYECICIKATADRIRAATTNGYRVALQEIAINTGIENYGDLNIPASSWMDVAAITNSDSSEVKIYWDEKQIFAQTDQTEMWMRTVSGDFPDLTNLLAMKPQMDIGVSKGGFLGAVERVALLGEVEKKEARVRLQCNNQILTLSAKSDRGCSEEEILLEEQVGDFGITLNVRHLLDVAKSGTNGRLSLRFSGEFNPVQIISETICGFLYIVSPVRN